MEHTLIAACRERGGRQNQIVCTHQLAALASTYSQMLAEEPAESSGRGQRSLTCEAITINQRHDIARHLIFCGAAEIVVVIIKT